MKNGTKIALSIAAVFVVMLGVFLFVFAVPVLISVRSSATQINTGITDLQKKIAPFLDDSQGTAIAGIQGSLTEIAKNTGAVKSSVESLKKMADVEYAAQRDWEASITATTLPGNGEIVKGSTFTVTLNQKTGKLHYEIWKDDGTDTDPNPLKGIPYSLDATAPTLVSINVDDTLEVGANYNVILYDILNYTTGVFASNKVRFSFTVVEELTKPAEEEKKDEPVAEEEEPPAAEGDAAGKPDFAGDITWSDFTDVP